MAYSAETSNNHSSGMRSGDIQCVCEHIKADIDSILNETKHMDDGDRLEKLRRLNELKQILSSIEDINHSIDDLLKKQFQKRTSDIH